MRWIFKLQSKAKFADLRREVGGTVVENGIAIALIAIVAIGSLGAVRGGVQKPMCELLGKALKGNNNSSAIYNFNGNAGGMTKNGSCKNGSGLLAAAYW